MRLARNEGQTKFIVVDFYMPSCHYCKEFMPDYNEVVDFMSETYGDQV